MAAPSIRPAGGCTRTPSGACARWQELQQLYPPALLDESVAIAERCSFSLSQLHYEYPPELVPDGLTAGEHLHALTEAGIARRWPRGVPATIRATIERELALIVELHYEHFFLTVHDVVEYARRENILCQGRGSAANSAVCYALGITEIDPARMQLLFERFISRERNEPPDIDVDFEHERREEVVQYIYRKYGRERAALAATVICYRTRSAVRDVGRALGVADADIDRLTRLHVWWDEPGEIQRKFAADELGIEPALLQRLMRLVRELIGFPRHLSQHVGGFVISGESLSALVPVENAAMPDRTVIQWDKDDLESLGLLKVDVLALGMLTAMQRCFDLIEGYRGVRLRMQDIPSKDNATFDMICRAETIGVFQIESRAQMSMLPRLQPRNFYDLVIEVAIVRPGPIQGDMVHPYLQRREDPQQRQLPERGAQGRAAANPRRADLPGAGDADRGGGRGFHSGRGRRAAPCDGRLEAPRRTYALPRAAAVRHGQERLQQRIRRADLQADPGLRRIWFSRIARRLVRAADLHLLLAQMPRASRLCRGADQQPADGFLFPGADHAGCAPQRRHGAAGRCRHQRLGLHARAAMALHRGSSPALRLGLRLVRGLPRADAERIVADARAATFASIDELAARAQLSRRSIQALAAAGALSAP